MINEDFLTDNQRKTLNLISGDWAKSPPLVRTATLLSLKDRRLIERRNTPGLERRCFEPYTSEAYQWRRTPIESRDDI